MQTLNVHFLNVGHGDCTLIEFPSGRTTMIDINNGEDIDEDTKKEIYSEIRASRLEYLVRKMNDSKLNEQYFMSEKGYDIKLTNPIEWLRIKNISELFRFICTHPDMDHISGLDALRQAVPIVNFWDVEHTFDHEESEFEDGRYSYSDWKAYKDLRVSETDPKRIHPLRGHSLDHWKADGIYILSPDQPLIDIAHEKKLPNHLSYVLMIVHGNTKIYLCGDATNDQTLPNLFEYYGEEFFKKKDGELVILKAPHHGRESGFYEPFVSALQPDAVIVSVGKKPSTDSSNKYRNHSQNVWSTRWKGNISLSCDLAGSAVYDFEYDR